MTGRARARETQEEREGDLVEFAFLKGYSLYFL